MNGDSSHLLLLEDGFRIEGWMVVPRANELVRPGETVHVEPKPMEVLLYLASHAGEAVSREELMGAAWPGVYVTEHALNRCVSSLRKLLDDDAHTPRVIETIPKVGYRLIAPIERVGDSAAAPVDALHMRVTAAPTRGPSQERLGFPLWAALSGGAALVLVLVVSASLLTQSQAPSVMTRPLTSDPGVETQVAWSPEGTQFAYVHRDAEGARRLYVRLLGADTPLQLTDGPSDGAPAWSPDGATIAFVRCEPAPCRLFAVSPLGGEVKQLDNEPVSWEGGQWTPNGEAFVLSGSLPPDGNQGLTLLHLNTGIRRSITDPAEGYRDSAPRFPPDGASLVFLRRSNAGDDLYRIAFPDGSPERLTFDQRAIAGHTWSRDERSILFSSNRAGVYALWRIPADGGDPEPVTGPAVRDPGGPAVAPAGDRMVVEDWVFEINLWEAGENGEVERLVASTLWDKQPHVSPDGTRLIFVSNRTGPPEIWITGRDGGRPMRLTNFGGASVEHPRFSPDGRRIVFQARRETQSDLYVLDADGGIPRRLTTHAADEVAPRWSRNGDFIYFGSDRSGAWQVWRIPVEGGEAIQVTEHGGYTAEETMDGALLVARYAEAGLWRVSSGAEEKVAALPAPGDWGNWAVTARGVIVLERDGNEMRLVALSLATWQPTPLPFVVRDVAPGEPGLTLPPDGDAVFVAQIDRIEADLLLVEPFE